MAQIENLPNFPAMRLEKRMAPLLYEIHMGHAIKKPRLNAAAESREVIVIDPLKLTVVPGKIKNPLIGGPLDEKMDRHEHEVESERAEKLLDIPFPALPGSRPRRRRES